MARLFANAQALIGETPLWRGDHVLWTDPVQQVLLRAAEGEEVRRIPVAAPLWGLAARSVTVVATLEDRVATIAADGTIDAGLAAAMDPGCRFNDLAVDPQGRIWIGAMHRGVLATRGSLYVADDAAPLQVATGLGVPNGMKISADGHTLFVIDTLARTLLAYPIEGLALGEPVILSDFMNVPGKPDGMALLADGRFLVAMWGGACIAELTPDGATVRSWPVPAPHVSSVCLDRRGTALVSTSRMRLSDAALAAAPASGGLFALQLDRA